MKKLILALLVCCSTVAYGQTTNESPVTETTHQMGDDGAIKVTLPFTFTYYNKQFTDTWMYDNGVISFLQPGSQGSLSPWQWYAQPFDQVNANYYIASLWADIAPVYSTKYITSTDGTYMKYTWQDIAEYYSVWGNWILNTFSTTLKDDGTIETHYTKINLQTSAISVGTVGDKNAGEYNQIYYSPCCIATNTSMIPDWTIAGVPPPPPPPPVVVQPDVYVAPQVIEEPVTQTTVATVVAEPEPTVAVTTTTTPTTTTAALVQTATESSPASVTTASIAAATSSVSSDSSSNKMSVADAQSIARANQKNAAQLVNSVISNSIESSMVQTTSTDSDTNTNNDAGTTNTITTSTTSNISIVATQSNNSVSDAGTNNATATSSSISLSNFARLPGSFTVDSNNETSENRIATTETTMNDTSMQETKLTSSNTEIINLIADETNPTSVRSLAANNVPAKQVEDDQEKKNIEITDISKDSQVSELTNFGVQLTELQVLPIGYNIYLTAVIKDAPFYAPKAIYSNQAVVDNAPAQRLLQLASDAKFEEMVSQQYGEQK